MAFSESRPIEELKELAKQPGKVHFVSQVDRPGVNLFAVRMEYTHYPPRSERNKLLELRIIPWPVFQGEPIMHWMVLTIPESAWDLATQMVKECGLRIADGIPMMFGGGGPQTFPMEGNNVYSLENSHEHPVYSHDQAAIEKLKKQEDEECRRIVMEDRKKLVGELHDQGYTDEQILRLFQHWDRADEDYDEEPHGNIQRPGGDPGEV